MSSKKRLDILLVEKGLCTSREKAKALILSGSVLVNDQPETKSGSLFDESALIRVRGNQNPYVSRSALKLKQAIESFEIPVSGLIAMDVGASTGGFTQVLLEKGVKKVFAIDVGHNQMDWLIRNDSRVVCIEKLNARDLQFDQIGQKIDLIVVDVSFISLTKIIPALLTFFEGEKTTLVTLIKPQFEVGREFVEKGGIVRNESAVKEMLEQLQKSIMPLGLERKGLIKSSLKGTDGNQEYLAYWKLQNT